MFKQLNIISIILFLISCQVFSQENSAYFLEVLNSTEYIKERKETILDSLFSDINYNNFYDIHEYSRWIRKNGDLEKAISINKRIINKRELQESDNDEIRSRLLKNLGYFYYLINEYYQSLYYYKQATLISGHEENSAKCFRKMGQIFFVLGDYYNAEKHYDKALIFSKNTNLNLHIGILINASINLKKIKSNENFTKAILFLKQALSLINSNKKVTTEKRTLEVYKHLGNTYCEYLNLNSTENLKKSYKNYSISLEMAKKLRDSSKTSEILNNIGYLHLLTNEDSSINYFEKSLDYSNKKLNSSTVYSNISAYYVQKEQFNLSLKNTNESINILMENKQNAPNHLLNKDTLKTNKYKFYLLNKLIDKGIILNKLNRFEEAINTFKLCDYLLDLVRYESNNKDSKLFWQEKASLLFSEATKASYNINDKKSAFYFIEKNKAILLLENITKQKYNPKNEINFDAFKDLKMSNYKAKYFLNESKIMTLKKVQNNLSLHTVLLDYIINDDIGYLISVSKKKINLHEICDLDQLNQDIKSYLQLISKPISNKEDFTALKTYSENISKALIPQSLNIKNKKKLLIIPDCILQNIPFESLNYNNRLLITTHEISYAYSYSFLIKNNKLERNPEKQLISFAPYSFNYDNLEPLNHSLYESEEVTKALNGNNFENELATTDNFKKNSYDYNIINISSHANASDSIAPWIAFKDQKLYLEEIYQTKNQADLVVLSACKTSLGDIKKGEGVFSLARGFLRSGSKSVVASLWNVNDKSNSEISISFYNYLKKGKSKSASLRQAKLDYLNTHSLSDASPYYWSSMVLIGDADKINLNSKTMYYIALLALLSILLFFIYKKIKNRG